MARALYYVKGPKESWAWHPIRDREKTGQEHSAILSASAAENLSPYHYSQLGDFQYRILTLLPAKDYADPLSCTLRINGVDEETWECRDVDEEPWEYDAISYAWGDSDDSNTISVLDNSPSYFRISSSVATLLRQLRLNENARHLWIDAICINQDNTPEKNTQVARMLDIYQKASNVIIWLGHCEDYLPEVLQFFGAMQPSSPSCGEEYGNLKIDKSLQANLSFLSWFFARPWFFRRWIIQEATSCPRTVLVCGSAQINFDHFLTSFSSIRNFLEYGINLDRGIIDRLETIHSMRSRHRAQTNVRKSTGSKRDDFPILNLLDRFSSAQCSNDRDRVYAIIGLSDDVRILMADDEGKRERWLWSRILLRIQYDASVEHIYCELAKEAIDHRHKWFQVLQCAGTFRPKLLSSHVLPSWVPDWRCERLYRSMLCINTRFNADGRGPSESVQLLGNDTLAVTGWRFSPILGMTDQSALNGSRKCLSELIHHWWDFFIRKDPELREPQWNLETVKSFINTISVKNVGFHTGIHFSGRPFLDDNEEENLRIIRSSFEEFAHGLFQWLHAGACRGPDEQTMPSESELDISENLARLKALFVDVLGEPNHSCSSRHSQCRTLEYRTEDLSFIKIGRDIFNRKDKTPLDQEKIRLQLQVIMQIMGGRHMFVSENGYKGICPEQAVLGDLVAVIADAETPFILRCAEFTTKQRVLPGKNAYQVIGDCYLPEIMLGEALQLPEVTKDEFLIK